MRWSPKDAVAVVTGASSGIGNCLTRQLLEQGASVVAVARRREPLEQIAHDHAASAMGGTVIPLAGDITDPATRQQVVQAASSLRGGAVDLLVNNAGVGAIGAFADATPRSFASCHGSQLLRAGGVDPIDDSPASSRPRAGDLQYQQRAWALRGAGQKRVLCQQVCAARLE